MWIARSWVRKASAIIDSCPRALHLDEHAVDVVVDQAAQPEPGRERVHERPEADPLDDSLDPDGRPDHGGHGLAALPGGLVEVGLDFHGDLVAQLERAEESRVRRYAKRRLPNRRASLESAGGRAVELQAQRPRPAVQR